MKIMKRVTLSCADSVFSLPDDMRSNTPPPTPTTSGGTYNMLVPHHVPPPPPPNISRGKRYTPYHGYWLPMAITQNTPFPGFLVKSSRDYTPENTPFPRELGHACGPLFIRVGGGAEHLIWSCR